MSERDDLATENEKVCRNVMARMNDEYVGITLR
jgi:hypothetical protein